MMTWREFEDRGELARALADDVVACIRAADDADRRFALAVSGGSTPRRLFGELSNRIAAWDRVDLVLVDERWTGAVEQRNETLVRSELLRGEASRARFWSLWAECGHLRSEAAARALESKAAQEGRFPPARPLDLVLLGMGLDGHTASLFPEAPQLERALSTRDAWIAVDPVTAPHARVSMTLSAIATATRVLLHIEGADKRDVLERALAPDAGGAAPIRSVAEGVDALEVWWAP